MKTITQQHHQQDEFCFNNSHSAIAHCIFIILFFSMYAHVTHQPKDEKMLIRAQLGRRSFLRVLFFYLNLIANVYTSQSRTSYFFGTIV